MRVWLPLLVLACGSEPVSGPVDWSAEPGVSAPLPGVLHLRVGDAVRGAPLELDLSGAPAGASVHVVASTGGLAPGPCPAPLGGTCLDVPAPLVRLATLRTDAHGHGATTVPLPSGLRPGLRLGLQAVLPAGADSATSAPVERITCPDGMRHDGVLCVAADACRIDNGGCGPWDAAVCLDGGRVCVPMPDAHAEDHAALTAGVASIDVGGSIPSVLIAHGRAAFPLVVDEGDSPIAVAGRVGRGRFVAFGHESYLGSGVDGPSDLGALAANAAHWALPDGGTVGIASGLPALEARLRDEGFSVVSGAAPDADGLDAWVGNSSTEFDDADVFALQDRVWSGGAVILGGQAWWWSFSNADVPNRYPGNRVGNALGVSWTASYADGGEDSVSPTPVDGCIDAWVALVRLVDHAAGAPLAPDDLAVCADTVEAAIGGLSLDVVWFDGVEPLIAALGGVSPTALDPIVPADAPLDLLVARYDARLNDDLPARRITAHPAAADFPGAVPADAPRVDRVVTVDGTHTGWNTHYWYSGAGSARLESTGLYAAAGDVVAVTVPPEVVGAGLELQIGMHSDSLWALDTIQRSPDVVNRTALDATTVEVASRFGGLIAVTVPRDSDLGPLAIGIAGAVEAPRYVLGETDPATWAALRDAAAPWAELASDRLVLTVPSSVVRDLANPSDVTALWAELLDGAADLAGVSRERPRAERLVVDRQISAGWMHSGYPIMGHDSEAADWVDVDAMRDGMWGPLHEIGHNHQWGPWVLPGTTESSVNLWSVYLSEEHLGIDRLDAHPAIGPGEREARIAAYLATGPDFDAWSVWTALDTYLQLQEAFGWGFYTGVFERYHALPVQPSGDDAVIDEWVVQTSLEAGLDLTGFYAAWGMPFTGAAVDRVAHLPPWVGHPME
ncbi:MAG: hypothetical protein ACI8PZ_002081 [Myxococcota bacterium]|jgi:hypothetical protein